MSDDSLIPPPPRHSGRYAARPEQPRGWTPQEELALLPVLLACESEHAYLAACRVLCDVLGRTPVYPPTARPTARQRSDDCQALVERRTVTSLITGNAQSNLLLHRLARSRREDESLTWAEKTKFLQPYARKEKRANARVSPADLMRMLERPPDQSEMVEDYLSEFLSGRAQDQEFHEVGEYAHAPRRELQLAKLVTRFISTDPQHGGILEAAWDQLVAYATPLAPPEW